MLNHLFGHKVINRKTIYTICGFSLAAVITITCKTRYAPPVLSHDSSYLVVDGFIVPNEDSTVILLSRTIKISDTLSPHPETGASIQVTGENNQAYPLAEKEPGRYVCPGLNLNTGGKYRLDITTANGAKYQSDFVEVKLSPPVDSLNWAQDSLNNVHIFTGTHDAAGKSIYYKWDYVETWEYHSKDDSYYDWVNHHEIMRDSTQHVFACWRTKYSSGVNIASTAKQDGDVVYQQPVISINNTDERISVRYSIQVKQYVLTNGAYQFWDALKKSTEQLGSIFDAQPYQAQSNIRCINDTTQLVIGYVSISSGQTKRLFIKRPEVHWAYAPYYLGYDCDTINPGLPDMDYYLPNTGPRFYTYMGRQVGGNYVVVRSDCVDCRVFGGSNIKPAFWY